MKRIHGFAFLLPLALAASAADNTIDRNVNQELANAGVTAAPKTTDFEFIRRVTLDLTGRIPTTERVIAFTSDSDAGKRARLIDELLASPEFADKWTMFFGDLLRNTARTDQVTRFEEGRNVFYAYIRKSIAANKPYDVMARELIAADGGNSWEQGELNWLVGGFVTGGPQQDIWDQQAVNTFETFLGVSHLNCLLCHNGAGHLDSLSLWGKNMRRTDAWGVASFFSRTAMTRERLPDQNNRYYWTVNDNAARFRNDYTLNTTTGNRPARCAGGAVPAAGERCAATAVVAPKYLDGEGPQPGETYRAALARKITGDFQFARAAVNYVWAAFFNSGIVEPVNQFDLARLDPDNPPPAPWTLQPTNARLLNALAQDFIVSGYDLRGLMREITTSDTYQLSSRYEGEWNPAWEPLFARHRPRRLWGEEIHDAIAQASNVIPSYNVRQFGPVRWAMQLPEPRGLPDGGGRVTQFLDSFLRGNREDQPRRDDGSVLQALSLMNHTFVVNRTRTANNGGPDGKEPNYVARSLAGRDDGALVDSFYLTVLSRPPAEAEKAAALEVLRKGPRQQAAENLLWVLFNKVDFIYNY